MSTDTTLPAPLVPAEVDLRCHAYEQRKAEFLAEHPGAAADEIEEACKRLAEKERL